jgi:hypothetical protein
MFNLALLLAEECLKLGDKSVTRDEDITEEEEEATATGKDEALENSIESEPSAAARKNSIPVKLFTSTFNTINGNVNKCFTTLHCRYFWPGSREANAKHSSSEDVEDLLCAFFTQEAGFDWTIDPLKADTNTLTIGMLGIIKNEITSELSTYNPTKERTNPCFDCRYNINMRTEHNTNKKECELVCEVTTALAASASESESKSVSESASTDGSSDDGGESVSGNAAAALGNNLVSHSSITVSHHLKNSANDEIGLSLAGDTFRITNYGYSLAHPVWLTSVKLNPEITQLVGAGLEDYIFKLKNRGAFLRLQPRTCYRLTTSNILIEGHRIFDVKALKSMEIDFQFTFEVVGIDNPLTGSLFDEFEQTHSVKRTSVFKARIPHASKRAWTNARAALRKFLVCENTKRVRKDKWRLVRGYAEGLLRYGDDYVPTGQEKKVHDDIPHHVRDMLTSWTKSIFGKLNFRDTAAATTTATTTAASASAMTDKATTNAPLPATGGAQNGESSGNIIGRKQLLLRRIEQEMARAINGCVKDGDGDAENSAQSTSPEKRGWRSLNAREKSAFFGHRQRGHGRVEFVRVRDLEPGEVPMPEASNVSDAASSSSSSSSSQPPKGAYYLISRERWMDDWSKVVGTMASVDPGIRVLYTIFSPSSLQYFQIGYGWTLYMKNRFNNRIDRLQSEIDSSEKLVMTLSADKVSDSQSNAAAAAGDAGENELITDDTEEREKIEQLWKVYCAAREERVEAIKDIDPLGSDDDVASDLAKTDGMLATMMACHLAFEKATVERFVRRRNTEPTVVAREILFKKKDIFFLRKARKKAVERMEDLAYIVLKSFDVLMLPKFDKSSMLAKQGRATARMTMLFGHGRVRDRLIRFGRNATSEMKDIRIVGEEYSTQCCPHCAKRDFKVGWRKFHRCESSICKATRKAWDRDTGSALSIFKRYFPAYVEDILRNAVEG